MKSVENNKNKHVNNMFCKFLIIFIVRFVRFSMFSSPAQLAQPAKPSQASPAQPTPASQALPAQPSPAQPAKPSPDDFPTGTKSLKTIGFMWKCSLPFECSHCQRFIFCWFLLILQRLRVKAEAIPNQKINQQVLDLRAKVRSRVC